MAYAGLPPATFTNNLTNVQLVDDISGSFNGSTQTFALTSSSAPFHAVSARSLIVVLGGIVQKPQVDYTVDGANITFTVAPVAGLTFAARNIYGLNYLNNVNDGVITPAKLSTGAPTWNTGGTVTVSGDLNVTGSFNSGTQGLFWGDNEPANFGDGNDLKIYHDGSNSYIKDQGTGGLFIQGSGGGAGITVQDPDGNNFIKCIDEGTGGTVELYKAGQKKLETTTTGINVSGTLKVNDISSLDSTTLSLGLEGGANGFINTQESLYVNIDSNNNETGKRFEIRHGATDASGTQLFTVLDSGLVGIGTDNPSAALEVHRTIDLAVFVNTTGTNNSARCELINGNGTTSGGYSYVRFNNNDTNNQKYAIGTYGDNNFQVRDEKVNSIRLLIKPDGNVGIGTTDPDKKLRVEGDARITGTLTMGTASISINGAHEYPTIRPTLDLNFAATKTLDRRITFTRDSIGTYVDELGIIRTAPNNTPRFDHDPTTGESLGLLIEESRTNILGNSTNLTDNNGNDWDNVNGTIAVNQTTAPDGTNTAASFTTTSGNAEHSVVWAELVPTGDVTASVWVKTNTYSIVSFVLYGEPNSIVSYNISTSTVYNQASNVSRATIKEYPNGWYRISATMNCTVAASRTLDYMLGTGNFNASGTESFYYWGPQVEAGSFETSYIPTFASNTSVTRAADFAKITGTNFTDFYNSSEGTLFAESSFADLTTTNQGTVQLWYSSTDHIGMGYRWGGGASGTYGFYIRNTSDELYRSPSGVTANTFVKTSLAYKSDAPYGASSLNGETAVVDTSINLPTAATEMTIGYGNASPSTYRMKQGHIKSLKYYNKRLPDAQLQGLTAQ